MRDMKKFSLKIFAGSLLVCICAIALVATDASAADRYWIRDAGSGAGNWNDTDNWATESEGASGASVPGSSDLAIFDGAGGDDANCNIDATVNIIGLQVDSGYSGTISADSTAHPLTVGTSDINLDGGTFSWGSGAVTMNYGCAFTVDGATVNLGSAEYTVNATADWTLTSGSINAETSTVIFYNRTNTLAVTGDITLNNVMVNNGSGRTVVIGAGNTLTVAGTLTLRDGAFNQSTPAAGGTVDAQGDIIVESTYDMTTALIKITGGNSTLTADGGRLPLVIFIK